MDPIVQKARIHKIRNSFSGYEVVQITMSARVEYGFESMIGAMNLVFLWLPNSKFGSAGAYLLRKD